MKMTTIQDMTTGQRYTNGSGGPQWEVMNADKHTVKNLETGETKTIAMDAHCYLVELTITTVVEYNSKQTSICMIFQNNDGSQKKRGFVVTYNDLNKFYTTLKQAESATIEDFTPAETPIYWNADLGMSNLEALNS